MRLALIDYRHAPGQGLVSEAFIEMCALEDISVDAARTWDDFEKTYGPVNRYDGLLIHPGVEEQKKVMPRLLRRELPCAIITPSPIDYKLGGDVRILSYLDWESVIQFFRDEQKDQVKSPLEQLLLFK